MDERENLKDSLWFRFKSSQVSLQGGIIANSANPTEYNPQKSTNRQFYASIEISFFILYCIVASLLVVPQSPTDRWDPWGKPMWNLSIPSRTALARMVNFYFGY